MQTRTHISRIHRQRERKQHCCVNKFVKMATLSLCPTIESNEMEEQCGYSEAKKKNKKSPFSHVFDTPFGVGYCHLAKDVFRERN